MISNNKHLFIEGVPAEWAEQCMLCGTVRYEGMRMRCDGGLLPAGGREGTACSCSRPASNGGVVGVLHERLSHFINKSST